MHDVEQRQLVAEAFATDRTARPCTSPTGGWRSWPQRRGEEQVTLAWLADQLQAFVDQNPDFEVPVERLATWLARGGTDDVEDD